MRKPVKRKRKQAKKFRRLSLTTVLIAAAILTIGAVTFAVSRQTASVKQPSSAERRPQVADKSGKNFVTVKVAGQDVQVDGQTGQIKELTPEEARKLAAGLKQLAGNKSVAGRPEVHHDDGAVSIDIEDRFRNVTVAKVDEDGTVVTACVDNPAAAAAFFGIDPKLITGALESPRKPTKATPDKN